MFVRPPAACNVPSFSRASHADMILRDAGMQLQGTVRRKQILENFGHGGGSRPMWSVSSKRRLRMAFPQLLQRESKPSMAACSEAASWLPACLVRRVTSIFYWGACARGRGGLAVDLSCRGGVSEASEARSTGRESGGVCGNGNALLLRTHRTGRRGREEPLERHAMARLARRHGGTPMSSGPSPGPAAA